MYNFLDTFLFRTPYFPFTDLSYFEEKLHNPVFKEMLQVATPDLSMRLDKAIDKVLYSAYLYYQRACTRPTPFGLFAGCSVGIVGEYTKIQLSEQATYKRNTRLDMDYICALTLQIEKNRNIREQLRYYPNNSIYPVGNHLRYVEYYYQKKHRMHQITQVINSDYLQTILALAKNGTLFPELVIALVNDEIIADEAVEFIHDLIDAQVLVSELEPSVTNIDPLTTLITRLNELQNIDSEIISILSAIEELLSDIDRYPIGTTGNVYPKIVENIKKTKIEAEIKYLFQTDMFKPVQEASVSRYLIKDIQQALVFLNKITYPVSRTNLSQFRENFIKRYDNREMPLLLVLDNELGIGYAGNTMGDISPLVDDLVIPRGNSLSNVSQFPIQFILSQKYQQSSQKIIELTDEDVKGVEIVWDDLPDTISVICQILQDNNRERCVFIKAAGGQSAANLLGRFCHLNKEILNHTLAITEKEAQAHPDAIIAEIVHLPESRIGNILLRPVLRPYEIPYLAKTSVSEEFELRADDLYVSVKNDRIILFSNRLGKEIIPRMSTAHNYNGQNSMPVYHFLCDIQHQNNRSGLGFFWNETIREMDYLPRVIYKNCILSRTRWIVRGEDTKVFAEIKEDKELLVKIKEWQNKRNIPDRVVLADGDNELYIDMNNPLSIRAWLSVVKKRQLFSLEEFLFDLETAVVHAPEGVFTNEFIFAFYRESTANK